MAVEREEHRGEATQGDSPVWEPLLAAIGEELAGDFMWMFEARLTDGRLLQAYKHIATRRYLHLGPHGSAFVYESRSRYRKVPLGRLVLEVVAPHGLR
jgi:hypothetical protein